MSVQVADILDGFYTRLTGGGDFNTSIGGRLWLMQAKRNETMPFAVYTPVSRNEADTFDTAGVVQRIQLTVWADAKSSNARACTVIADEARERLHGERFTASNHDILPVEADFVRGPTLDDDAWRVDTDYIIRGLRS